MKNFEELGLTPEVLQGIKALGFEHPMPIQERIIPVILESENDLIGLAQTGTGKTAAFGLPIVQRSDPEQKTPQALVLAPTRELCLQIASDVKSFAKYVKDLHVVAVYGGAEISRQIKALKKGAQVIIATPGRMNDLLNKRNAVNFSTLRMVVLDEADEMLNMGFKEELDAILDQTPPTKQTLLFSATMPKEVLAISKNYMHDPQEIAVGPRNAGAENVEHICYPVRSKDRYLALKRIVDYHPEMYGIIFCRTRQETKDVADKLIQEGYNADALHGDLSQAQREYIMHKFRIKNLQLLIATDVAARGLDVKDISHIIHYNLSDEDIAYTHRSGRTGRAGQKGISIAIVNMREKFKIKRIESKIKKKFLWKVVPRGEDICEKQLLSFVDRMQKIEVNHKEIDKFLPTVYEKFEWLSREELIKHFVSLEFNRFLDYYRDATDLSAPEEKESRKRRKKGDSSGKRFSNRGGEEGDSSGKRFSNRGVEEGFARFYINLGYRDSVSPRDLIGLINRCTRKKNIDIGRIDLMKTFSFFEVDKNHAFDILSGFKGVEYNKRDVIVQAAQKEDQSKQEQAKKGERGKRQRTRKKKNTKQRKDK